MQYCHNMQNLDNDCGVAVIKSVLQTLKIDFSESELFKNKAFFDEGLSLYDLKSELSKYGIQANPYEIDSLQELSALNKIAILVVSNEGLSHYICFYANNNRGMIISDPTLPSLSHVNIDALSRLFEGSALIIEGYDKKVASPMKREKRDSFFLLNLIPKTLLVDLFFTNLFQIAFPIFLAIVYQFFFTPEAEHMHPESAKLFILTFLAFIVSEFILNYRSNSLSVRLSKIIQKKIVENYYAGIIANIDKFQINQSNVIGYLNNMIRAGQGLILKIGLVFDSLYALSLVVLLLLFSKIIPIIIMVLMLFYFIIISRKMAALANYEKYLLNSNMDFSGTFEDLVKGSQDIVIFDKHKSSKKIIDKKINTLFHSIFLEGRISAFMITLSGNMSMIMLFFICLASYYSIMTQQRLIADNVGIFVTFMITDVFVQIANSWTEYKKTLFSSEYLYKNKNISTEMTSSKSSIINLNNIDSIKINNCCFSYSENTRLIENLSLSLESSTITGIKGDNGVGKSTLLQLLLGIYSPQKGSYIINDLFEIETLKNTDITDSISFYSLEQHIFSRELRTNVSLDFLNNNEDIDYTFDTNQLNNKRIYSSGSNLSSGQKQKVLLERCFHKNAKIYLMDEPASNLDKHSKSILIQKLYQLKSKEKIVVVISHDEELLAICDQVISLNKSDNVKEDT